MPSNVCINDFCDTGPGAHLIGDWVDARVSLNDVEKRKY
jgi:hypothetical protein